MQVGFIGLGIMGASMASNLQKAGYKLVVHDLRRAEREPSPRSRREVGGDRPRPSPRRARWSSRRCRDRPSSRRWRSARMG